MEPRRNAWLFVYYNDFIRFICDFRDFIPENGYKYGCYDIYILHYCAENNLTPKNCHNINIIMEQEIHEKNH